MSRNPNVGDTRDVEDKATEQKTAMERFTQHPLRL